jgi:hypothetical protein
MAIDVVKEIVTASKAAIATLLPDFSQLAYEYDIQKNSERDNPKGYGFVPLSADFVEGRSLQHTTMSHRFQIILTTDFLNQSSDSAQAEALQGLYENMHTLAQDFMAKKLVLPTASYKVLLVRGLSFEEPEFFDDNKLIALRANIEMQYRFINNC